MQSQSGSLKAEIARLSSMTLKDHLNETKLSLEFPITKNGTKFIRRMELEFNLNQFGGGGGINYRWGNGKIQTAQMKVAYCWSTRRNKAGYFLGWREVERNARPGYIERDQLVARKSKKRLKALQMKRAEKLLPKNG